MAYYVRINGMSHGPFDESQLLKLRSRGSVSRLTEISENGDDWQKAEAFPFLFEPAPSPPPPPSPSSPAPPSTDWFFSINGTDGYSPVTAAEIERMLQSGQLNGNTRIWQQGQNARLIKNEPQFSGVITTQPPTDPPQKKPEKKVTEPTQSRLSLSRHTFVFLAITAGMFGIHDFYAKRNGQGAIHIALWTPWILVFLFSAFTALLGGVGVHVEVDWFQSASLKDAARGAYWMYLFFIVLPVASYVMAMFEIVFVTTDGAGRDFERF